MSTFHQQRCDSVIVSGPEAALHQVPEGIVVFDVQFSPALPVVDSGRLLQMFETQLRRRAVSLWKSDERDCAYSLGQSLYVYVDMTKTSNSFDSPDALQQAIKESILAAFTELFSG